MAARLSAYQDRCARPTFSSSTAFLATSAPVAVQKSPAARVPDPSRLLVITAHPDDESLFAPLLGGYCGVTPECTLLVMTRGENGPCVLASGCVPDLGAT